MTFEAITCGGRSQSAPGLPAVGRPIPVPCSAISSRSLYRPAITQPIALPEQLRRDVARCLSHFNGTQFGTGGLIGLGCHGRSLDAHCDEPFHHAVRLVVCSQKDIEAISQFVVAAAGLVEVRGAFGRVVDLQGGDEQIAFGDDKLSQGRSVSRL